MKRFVTAFLFALPFLCTHRSLRTCRAGRAGEQQGTEQNLLLNQSFWQAKPGTEALKAAVTKGADPAEMNAMSMGPVVMAINGGAPNEAIICLPEQKGNEVNKIIHDGRTYLF